MLLLLVLGVDGDYGKDTAAWHRLVAAAGNGALLWPTLWPNVRKNAELIGLMKHGPSAARKHEAVIKRLVERRDNAPDFHVEAMMSMCGPDCIVTARMYLQLPFLAPSAGHLPPPSAMRAMPSIYYPAMLELDVQHNESRAIGMSMLWLNKVKEARARLWGDAERDVCVTTVIALVREKLLPSVLSPPIGI